MQAAGATLPLYRLSLVMEGCATEGEMNANFFATLERGYTPINKLLGKSEGACSIVGSGPSIQQTYADLKGDVLAINGAIGFLLEKSIVPKWAMIWDAAEICEKFAVPHPDITYLIASRCHPKVFERLKDCNVVVWHAAGDNNIAELMNRPDVIAKQPCEEPLINGGTAGVTRGIYVGTALGYREVHIYGGDSSYSEDGQTHIRGSLVPEKDITVSIGDNPPLFFRTTPEWCAQVEEYRAIYTILMACNPPTTLDVHGSGMLKEMHERLMGKRKLVGDAQFIADISTQERERMERDAEAAKLSAEMSANEALPSKPLSTEPQDVLNACQ